MEISYTGIGSRETPPDVLSMMKNFGVVLAETGLVLRSGHADGADMAFEQGCIAVGGGKNIYLPWKGFNGAPTNDPDYIDAGGEDAMEIARRFHPAWDRCSPAARALHARNVHQILGTMLNEPSGFVICWTKNGRRGGGTGQALRIAEHYGVTIFDLALLSWEQAVEGIMEVLE